MVSLKKFLTALAVVLYSITPVFAGDSDRVRGYWQWQGPKMLDLTTDQKTAWAHLKKAHLGGIRVSERDLRLVKKRLRIAFQSSAGEEGLISRYKREYQITVGRSLTQHQPLLMGVPSQRFRRDQSKDSRKSWGKGCDQGWGKGHGKSPNKRHGMDWNNGSGLRWDKGDGKGWGKGYGKNSNKRYGRGTDKGAGKRGGKWQKNRKKKSFDSD